MTASAQKKGNIYINWTAKIVLYKVNSEQQRA